MATAQAAVPMTMSVGETYITRAGNTVAIRHLDDYDGRYFGDILDAEGNHIRIASFSEAGRYAQGRETDFDIVALAKAGA
jgi:hypothetical protein